MKIFLAESFHTFKEFSLKEIKRKRAEKFYRRSFDELDTMTLPAAIIFDLGRVLVRLDFSGVTARFPQLRIAEIIKFSAADDPQFMAFNRGEISPENFHAYLSRKFDFSLPFAEFCAAWTSVFSPMPQMETLLAELRAVKKFKLGLLSDTDPLHWNFIRENFPWLADSFVSPTLSFRIGVLKPQREAFLRAAENVETAPESCLFIDDRADNVAGAIAVGMRACQFSGAAALRAEFSRMGIL